MESLTGSDFTIFIFVDDWNVGSTDQFALVIFVLERAHTNPVMQAIHIWS